MRISNGSKSRGKSRFNSPMNPLPSVDSGNIAGSIEIAGQKRTYIVHVPATINCGIESVPLLIVFHADEGNAQQMMDLTQFNAIAVATLVELGGQPSPMGALTVLVSGQAEASLSL